MKFQFSSYPSHIYAAGTQGLGYCGYIVLLHLCEYACALDPTQISWRCTLADLLDCIPRSGTTLTPLQAEDFTTLHDKLRRVIPQLRAGLADRRALDLPYWLSNDEVMLALRLLRMPSSPWVHSAFIPISQLINSF